MVVMEEQANGCPTDDGAGAVPVTGAAPCERSPGRDGDRGPGSARPRQKLINVLAGAVRLVAAAFAVILVVRIGLAFVAVNPQNVIAEWMCGPPTSSCGASGICSCPPIRVSGWWRIMAWLRCSGWSWGIAAWPGLSGLGQPGRRPRPILTSSGSSERAVGR